MTADYGRSKPLRLIEFRCHSQCVEGAEAVAWKLIPPHPNPFAKKELIEPSHLMHRSANKGCRFGPHLQGTPLVTAFTARKQEASQVAGNVSKTAVYGVDTEDFAGTPGTAGAWRVRVHA